MFAAVPGSLPGTPRKHIKHLLLKPFDFCGTAGRLKTLLRGEKNNRDEIVSHMDIHSIPSHSISFFLINSRWRLAAVSLFLADSRSFSLILAHSRSFSNRTPLPPFE